MARAGATIRWSEGEAELNGALAVREAVFCVEQGVPREEELDGRDGEALHLVAVGEGDGEVLATLRLLCEGSSAKVGRVAVRRAWRGRGIASQMLEMALARARAEGCSVASLASQTEVTELYARAGFAVASEPFMEAGIAHVWMTLELSPQR